MAPLENAGDKDKGVSRRDVLRGTGAAVAAGTLGIAGCESPEQKKAEAVKELPKAVEEASKRATVLVADIRQIRSNPKIYENLPNVMLGGEDEKDEQDIKKRWAELSESEQNMTRRVGEEAENLADALDRLFALFIAAGYTREFAESEIRKILRDAGADSLGNMTQNDIANMEKSATPRHYNAGGFWFWYFWFYTMNSNRYNGRAWGTKDALGRIRGGSKTGGRGSSFGGGQSRSFGSGRGGFGRGGGGFGG